jgi:hypothetical protein
MSWCHATQCELAGKALELFWTWRNREAWLLGPLAHVFE